MVRTMGQVAAPLVSTRHKQKKTKCQLGTLPEIDKYALRPLNNDKRTIHLNICIIYSLKVLISHSNYMI